MEVPARVGPIVLVEPVRRVLRRVAVHHVENDAKAVPVRLVNQVLQVFLRAKAGAVAMVVEQRLHKGVPLVLTGSTRQKTR